jgi:hypothetical protein
LVSPEVTAAYPDGRKETKPLGSIYQYARYTPAPSQNSNSEVAQYAPEKPQSGRMRFLQRIDDLYQQLGVKV